MYRLPFGVETCCLALHAFGSHGLRGILQLVDMGLAARRPDVDWRATWAWIAARRWDRLARFSVGFAAHWLSISEAALPALRDAPRLPLWAPAAFSAFARRLEGRARPIDRAWAFLTLLHVSQRPATKCRQVLRLLAPDRAGMLEIGSRNGAPDCRRATDA